MLLSIRRMARVARLAVPDNITILPLPPKSPELNPVENIWQFMRDNWLSNRVFKSYDDIVDHCCDAWNKLIDLPWKIMSIGLRNWAHGSDQRGLVLHPSRDVGRDAPAHDHAARAQPAGHAR